MDFGGFLLKAIIGCLICETDQLELFVCVTVVSLELKGSLLQV